MVPLPALGGFFLKPTIYDIANKSGVSKSTVSRVLNNQDNISPEAKEKVLAAIKELNYMPSKLARGLTGNGFDAILALSHRSVRSTSGNPFFSDVIQSISAVSEKNDFDLILQTSKNNQEEAQKIRNKLNEKLIRGIIILSASQDGAHDFRRGASCSSRQDVVIELLLRAALDAAAPAAARTAAAEVAHHAAHGEEKRRQENCA